jgi:lipopolysaccharide transport system ATP-binding protein
MTGKMSISVKNLGKRYRIGDGSISDRHKTLRDSISNAAKASISYIKQINNSNNKLNKRSTFWALKDVSFDVQEGEVVGIIGRNGSGKTTLLKLISRIASPTEGFAEIHGRVGSLLEAGAGFHPELTGRENIYFSGSILGMTKKEINDKFDEIVKFSEMEKFLDMPSKRYSSGMYVKLGFSVAAHLEPEILLIDEVLAVGDVAFQKKCLEKMNDISIEGRTILFVSHNMNAITDLCQRAILLDAGKIRKDGEALEVVTAYLSEANAHPMIDLDGLPHKWAQNYA